MGKLLLFGELAVTDRAGTKSERVPELRKVGYDRAGLYMLRLLVTGGELGLAEAAACLPAVFAGWLEAGCCDIAASPASRVPGDSTE